MYDPPTAMKLPRLRLVRWLPHAIGPLILTACGLPHINGGACRVDTGTYAAIGHWACASGDPVALRYGDLPYFNKPPLALWIHGVLLYLLGPSLWVARLPSLAAAILATVSATRTARLLAGPGVATATGFVLATTLEFFRYTRAISLDLWMAAFLTAALVPAASALRHDRPRRLLVVGVWIGLALLVKPIAGLLTVVGLAAWLAWMGRARWLGWLAGAEAIAVAIAAPWHLAMIARFGDDFVQTYFLKQSIGRATGETFEPQPPTFFLVLLAKSYWPWLVVLAMALLAVLRRGRIDANPGRVRAERLAWVVGGLWLIALSAFASKHTRYLVPVYPLMAIVGAVWLRAASPGWVRIAHRGAERWLPPISLGAGVLALVLGLRVHGEPSDWRAGMRDFLGRWDGDPIWTTPDLGMRGVSCHAYLVTLDWPRRAHIDEGLAESIDLAHNPPPGLSPSVGDAMLFRTDGHLPPRPTDEVLWSADHLVIVRLATPYDGRP